MLYITRSLYQKNVEFVLFFFFFNIRIFFFFNYYKSLWKIRKRLSLQYYYSRQFILTFSRVWLKLFAYRTSKFTVIRGKRIQILLDTVTQINITLKNCAV